MGNYANVRNNFTKIPNQEEVPTKVLRKKETNFNNSLIVRLELCLGRMKECRLIYNIQLTWTLS